MGKLDGLVVGCDSLEDQDMGGRLLMASQLDEKTILELMAEAALDPSAQVSFDAMVTGLLAKEVLDSGQVKEGPSLVMTLAGLLKRGHRFSGEADDVHRALLADLTFAMRDASGLSTRALRGVQLGDQATHAVAGMAHRPTRSTSREFMLDRAAAGYGTALELSARFPQDPSLARTAASLSFFREAASLRSRVGRAAEVLSALLVHQSKQDFLNKGVMLGTMGTES